MPFHAAVIVVTHHRHFLLILIEQPDEPAGGISHLLTGRKQHDGRGAEREKERKKNGEMAKSFGHGVAREKSEKAGKREEEKAKKR